VILYWQTHGAGTITALHGSLFVLEENPIRNIPSPYDGSQGSGAIEATIDLLSAVSGNSSGTVTFRITMLPKEQIVFRHTCADYNEIE
jgi:hypothetical protein